MYCRASPTQCGQPSTDSFVATSLSRQCAASEELQRKPNHSTLHRMRERRLHVLKRQYQQHVLTVIGALV